LEERIQLSSAFLLMHVFESSCKQRRVNFCQMDQPDMQSSKFFQCEQMLVMCLADCKQSAHISGLPASGHYRSTIISNGRFYFNVASQLQCARACVEAAQNESWRMLCPKSQRALRPTWKPLSHRPPPSGRRLQMCRQMFS